MKRLLCIILAVIVFSGALASCKKAAPSGASESAASGTGNAAASQDSSAGKNAGNGGSGENPGTPSGIPELETDADPFEDTEADGEDNGEYTRALAKKNQEFNREDAELSEIRISAQPEKKWTIMVYMIGSNLESSLGAASADIAEMEASGIDLKDKNLVLYTGGSTRWQSDVPCDRNCILDLSKEGEERIVSSTDKNADMGAKETLSSFVNFCTEYYPSEHTALILWDHGGGPLWGYGSDELFRGDGLTLEEMSLAMQDTSFSGSKNLDIVGFDACLMGNLENMTVWAPFADYYVGSEELEPGDGWNYEFLKVFNETDDPLRITSEIVDTYAAYYENKQSEHYNPDVTLSAADLSEVMNVQNALGKAAEEMAEQTRLGGFSELAVLRREVKSFGLTGKAEEGTLFAYDLADLQNLISSLSGLSGGAAEELQDALSRLIIKNYSNVENAGGVTLYYPDLNRGQFYEARESYRNLELNDSYQKYLDELSMIWQQAGRADWAIESPVLQDGEYVIQLTQEQQEAMVSCTYSILAMVDEGQFRMVLANCPAEPDKDGVIRLPQDPKLVFLETGGEKKFWPAAVVEKSKKRTIYQTIDTRIRSGALSSLVRLIGDYKDISVVLSGDGKSEKLQVRTVNSASSALDASGKETINVSNYDAIYNYFQEKIPTVSRDGNLLPFGEWKTGDLSGLSEMILSDSFGFSLAPVSESGSSDYYYLVTLQDANGSMYTTEPAAIKPETDYYTKEERTDSGIIYYLVYPDHAELSGYNGTDTELVIPGEVDGVPLTRIGHAFGKQIMGSQSGYYPLQSVQLPDSITEIADNAFYSCYDLTSINFPEKLEKIGNQAFSYTGLTEVVLPAGVREIGAYAFSYCVKLERIVLPEKAERIGRGLVGMDESLREIVLSSENASYTVTEGALYTKDCRLLIAVPQALEGSFSVHPDTEEIGPDCFSRTSLSEVVLPDGLRTIRNYAFFSTINLQMPALPESLESVGQYAFSADWYELDPAGNGTEEQRIDIGKNLVYVGTGAFSGVIPRSFSVDPGNPRFSSREGALLSKAGDSIIEFAANRTKDYTVPSGVADMDLEILEGFWQYDMFADDRPFGLYFPDSLIRITGYSNIIDSATIHCSPGSYAESYALRNEIPISYETEPVLYEYELESGTSILRFEITKTHAVLYEFEGEDEEVTIPREVEGVPVTVIGNGLSDIRPSFSFSMTCKKLNLPDTIEVISAEAFQYFGRIEMNLPDSVRMIGDYALDSCYFGMERLPKSLEYLGTCALTGQKFPEGLHIPEGLTQIRPGAFSGVSTTAFIPDGDAAERFAVIDGSLFSADGKTLLAYTGDQAEALIPDGTEVIGEYALYQSQITAVTIPASVQCINAGAFSGCTKLVLVNFSEGLTEIGDHAFASCGMTELSLPESCEKIGVAGFYACSGLKSVKLFCSEIGGEAFDSCSSLEKVDFGDRLSVIGDHAFYRTAVSELTLPDSLYQIGDYAFLLDEEAVTETEPYVLAIGPNLRQPGNEAFGNLPISGFSVSEENTNLSAVSGFLTDKAQKVLYVCPPGLTGTVTIPDGIFEFADYSFCSCENVEEIVVPDSVTVIRSVAFDYYRRDDQGNQLRSPRIRCHKGSAAERFAIGDDWPYTAE